MSIAWNDLANGVLLGDGTAEGGTGTFRGALNIFNKTVVTDVNKNIVDVGLNTTNISANTAAILLNTNDIAANAVNIDLNTTGISALQAPRDYVLLNAQVTPPVDHVVGRIYFDSDSGTTKIQGGIDGVEVEVGHGEHIHVINNTGSIIPKGAACRHDGIAAGKVQIALAIATSFTNARVFGLAANDIAIGAEGALVTSGEIKDLDTNGLPVGIPLFLSDTVAGTYSTVIPDIISQVGGALVADALIGRFYVQTLNNRNLPTVLAGFQGHTPGNDVYSATTTPQDIKNYLTTELVVMDADALTGVITLSNSGKYRMAFSSAISFTSVTSTRTIYIEFYDITNSAVVYRYPKNIPRDATEDGFSFSWPFSEVLGNTYKMRISSSVPINVTFSNVSFDIDSVSIF